MTCARVDVYVKDKQEVECIRQSEETRAKIVRNRLCQIL
jgi:hypothetical protein